MEIKQFYDKTLAHASYAIESNGQVALVDPGRDPEPYFEWTRDKDGKIVAVLETHPHADFVSSHLEISKRTGAKVYVSKLLGADYDHVSFDTGDVIKLGNIELKAYNTPGHSPDSISIVATDENGKDHSVFTGDTLFIGDVGRPDLRENAGNIKANREKLARQAEKQQNTGSRYDDGTQHHHGLLVYRFLQDGCIAPLKLHETGLKQTFYAVSV